MKPVKVITDPAAMELLGDETRRRIVYLLRARELTISQVAEELRMTPQAIYHHIRKLLAMGMVEVTREERVGNFVEGYYRAAAEVFEFSWGGSGKSTVRAEQRLRDNLLSLEKIGIHVRVDEDDVSEIVKVQQKIGSLGTNRVLQEKVSKLDGVDFVGKQELTSTASLISLTDKQFHEWMELMKELRRLLRGLLAGNETKTKQQRTKKLS